MTAFTAPNLDAATAHPTVQTTDPQTGYSFDTTSPDWKNVCTVLPSCAALQWPGYATTCIPDVINGVEVMIQPWMGHCEQVFGRASFPGGFGGEVGVYVRVPVGRALPDLSEVPLLLRPGLLLLQLAGNSRLWWPDAKMQPAIDFTIINLVANNVLLRADQENDYWVNKWMQPDSYARYQQANVGKLPASITDYQMVYTVNGVTRSWTGASVSPDAS